MDEYIKQLASNIQLLVLDVDGVMTDGSLYISKQGEEIKQFNVLDGQGIKLLQRDGIQTAIITKRQSQIVSFRATELGINEVHQQVDNKLSTLKAILQKMDLDASQVAYLGDDLPDLACIQYVALGICVKNAHFSLKERAKFVTESTGGNGAIREVCDLLLLSRNKLNKCIEEFSL
jgi:3-deoxy-D-manno-octulosonate 8-phosphate phosphatase (KDO 8-P phosphatase)